MQYVTGVITDGFKQLLNGKLKPSAVVEAFQLEERNVFQDLREVPSSAEAYIEADPEAKQRWAWLIDYIRQKAEADPDADIHTIYSSAFFKIDYSLFPPLYFLCYYYRSRIFCESRMIICHVEYWRNELELSSLKYEYHNLKFNLLDLLKRVDADLKQLNASQDNLIPKLDYYIKRLLRDSLIQLIMESSRRYEHLLVEAPVTEEEFITEEEIFLKYLERPVPDKSPWYITSVGVKAKLEMILSSKDYLQKAEGLLADLRQQIAVFEDEEAKTELKKAGAVVEDTWLCSYLMVVPGKLSKYQLHETDENTRRLNDLNEGLEQPDQLKPEEKDTVNRLVRQMPKIIAALGEDFETHSAARELIHKANQIFSDEEKNLTAEPGEAYTHSLSKDYVSVYQISKDFDVHVKTINNNIKKHKIEALRLGNNSWLTNAEYERFKTLLTINKGQQR